MFLDTNILIYEWDHSDSRRREVARKLISDGAHQLMVSSQVLQEFAHNARRKLEMSDVEINLCLETYAQFRFVPVDSDMVMAAILSSSEFKISFWDALIIEAAVAGNCNMLYTEDLNHDQTIRGVKIVNPFM
ncbi:MAG: PIN domain-containing protein [Fimbriimonadaceae bacterium]